MLRLDAINMHIFSRSANWVKCAEMGDLPVTAKSEPLATPLPHDKEDGGFNPKHESGKLQADIDTALTGPGEIKFLSDPVAEALK